MAFSLTTFTDQLRYLPYNEWDNDYKERLNTLADQSPWRLQYHIEPKVGLLNDPNGFSYFNGQWQLFYQYYPFGPVHGLKSWFHLTSSNLFHWQEGEIALTPDNPFDSHGAYSGSAIAIDDQLFMFYTGNVRDENWQRIPYQNGAWMDQAGHVTKEKLPLITPPDFVTDHFRDPNIFEFEGEYYALLGAQLRDGNCGVILLYRVIDQDVKKWEYVGILDIGESELGYMVECPAIAFVEGHPVLFFCPQGLAQDVDPYDNIYPNKYIVAETFDPEHAKLVNPSTMQNVDEGFEYYAATTANGAHEEALSVAWIGGPEMASPTDDYGYQGALSMIRSLSLVDGKLHQTPVVPADAFSKAPLIIAGTEILEHNHYVLDTTIQPGDSETINFFLGEQDDEGLFLTVDATSGIVTLDRSHTDYPVSEASGTTRMAQVTPGESIRVNAYVDESLVEIYVNEGERVLTGRYFPRAGHTGVKVTQGIVHMF
ncbi:MAG: sucrose-6-phosphate hydrolase [Aerococcus sp.]|nr:sucrose-6-phosphate hydrolase [Aerococcus sp.]